MSRTVHIVGAGLAGLAAAVRLAGRGVTLTVHEATEQAGGRCRSYDDAATGMRIDNGTHILLSGNAAALRYLAEIGASSRVAGAPSARFPFIDLATGDRWALDFGAGRFPAWMFDPKRRPPGTGARDYLPLLRLLWPTGDRPLSTVIPCEGEAYERAVRPLLLAALNTEPGEGSAQLARAVVRESIAAGGSACRPYLAPGGLSTAFVEPALAFLARRGAELRYGRQLHRIVCADGAVATLDFGDGELALKSSDIVILAVPPYVACTMVPGLRVPDEFRAIINAHFRVKPPPDLAPMIGVLNGVAEWIFAFEDRVSVTVSGADRLLRYPRDELAAMIWKDVAHVAGLAVSLPPWQIVRERRATFAATPAQNARRPGARTAWRNLLLAGDWTATSLPATIESAIRSGNRAADLAIAP